MISVVIPTYNRAEYLKETIESVLNQTYRPLEIVLINDCSTDNTNTVINELKSKIRENDVELLMIWHSENQGCGTSIKQGFEAASGNYITYLASDDVYLDPDSLGHQRLVMSSSDWSYYQDVKIGPTIADSKLYKPAFIPRMRFLNRFIVRHPRLMCCILFWKNPVNSSSLMIRREIYHKYGGWFEWTKNADCDGALLMYYTYLNLKGFMLEGAPLLYRTHPKQVSNDRQSMEKGGRASRNNMLEVIRKDGPMWMRLLSRLFNWMRWL